MKRVICVCGCWLLKSSWRIFRICFCLGFCCSLRFGFRHVSPRCLHKMFDNFIFISPARLCLWLQMAAANQTNKRAKRWSGGLLNSSLNGVFILSSAFFILANFPFVVACFALALLLCFMWLIKRSSSSSGSSSWPSWVVGRATLHAYVRANASLHDFQKKAAN